MSAPAMQRKAAETLEIGGLQAAYRAQRAYRFRITTGRTQTRHRHALRAEFCRPSLGSAEGRLGRCTFTRTLVEPNFLDLVAFNCVHRNCFDDIGRQPDYAFVVHDRVAGDHAVHYLCMQLRVVEPVLGIVLFEGQLA